MANSTTQYDANASVKVAGSVFGIASGTAAQLIRGAWPINQKIEITKIIVTNNSGLPGFLQVWDQDLSNTTPVGFGSATGPLLTIPYGATTTSGLIPVQTVLSEAQLPALTFECGIAIQANGLGTGVVFEGRRV
jgi:hypothetical protein